MSREYVYGQGFSECCGVQGPPLDPAALPAEAADGKSPESPLMLPPCAVWAPRDAAPGSQKNTAVLHVLSQAWRKLQVPVMSQNCTVPGFCQHPCW